MSEKSAAEKLAIIEQEATRVRAEYNALKNALGDPHVSAWIDGRGRVPARQLTVFEAASVKRMYALRAELRPLEAAEAALTVRTLDEIGGNADSDENPAEDPETLLRAAMVVLARAWKAGHRDVEHRVTLKAIAAYLRSLDEE